MRQFITTALLLSSLCLAQTAAPAKKAPPQAKPRTAGQSPVAKSVKEIDARKQPLPPFTPQQPKRIQLANGMVIFLQEDHELPLIDGFARIHGGAREVALDKTGLASVMGDTWRTGGTKDKTGDQLDDFLEARAASVETGANVDSTNVSFSCLKGDFNDVFAIFAELLRAPEFRQDKIDLAKQQLMTAISRRNEDPSEIASRESTRLIYGPESPYGKIPEFWTVEATTRQDLMDFHRRFVHPNNVIFGVVGDFDSAQMEQLLRKTFEPWPKGPDAQIVEAEFRSPQPGIYLAEKNDVNQSNIQLVTLGIRRDNPDYYATRVLNEALGGGFSARLFSRLRTQRGLAYGVGGGIGYAFDHLGATEFFIATKSESTAESIEALRQEIAKGVSEPFTDREVSIAKANILNSFVFRFDSKEKVLGEKMAYEFYHYPLDTLERFRKEIEKITTEDVNRVAKKYLKPEQFATVVVGNATEFDKPLSTLGPVKPLDISIPQTPPGKPTASQP
jgi:zinc protease